MLSRAVPTTWRWSRHNIRWRGLLVVIVAALFVRHATVVHTVFTSFGDDGDVDIGRQQASTTLHQTQTVASSSLAEALNQSRVLLSSQRVVLPQFWLATNRPAVDDVSALTQLTLDRFETLVEMSQLWGGPMSVTLYLKANELSRLNQLFQQYSFLGDTVDLHLWIQYHDAPYPVNHLRNLAVEHCSTDHVIMMDVDFLPSVDMYSELHRLRNWRPSDNTNDKLALVVPAFEVGEGTQIPQTRAELLRLRQSNPPRVQQVHLYKGEPAHKAVNYYKWYALNISGDHGTANSTQIHDDDDDDDQIYHIEYDYLFEPYYMVPKALAPRYDERFIGYGNDKAALTYEMAAAGFDMYVLPRPFMVHKDHGTPAWRAQGQGSQEAWQRWAEFCNDMSQKYNGFLAPIPKWLKEACARGDCPTFWNWFTHNATTSKG